MKWKGKYKPVLLKNHIQHLKLIAGLLTIILTIPSGVSANARQDFVVENVYEAALDLPRILFLLERKPTGPPLMYEESFELNYAFLDTGASGIMISRETANNLGISVHKNAQFVEVGIGGDEVFDVSEPLYVGLADYKAQNPYDPNIYKDIFGPACFQVKKDTVGLFSGLLSEPIDVIGMPVMHGRIVVLHSGATNSLEYFAAEVKKQGDLGIPDADIKVSLRFKDFTNPNNPKNIGTLPVLARNPVIDGIAVNYRGKSTKGTWLLDTGATVSFISTRQANRLGLTNANGTPLIKPDFSVPVGGVGAMIQINGFEIDKLIVPTLSGSNLVFKNARLGVRDIKYFDEKQGRYEVIDGVLGSNFLCASAKMGDLLPSEIGETIFESIVLDMKKGTLGFVLRPEYQKPAKNFR
jgi:hypothetical protein